MSSSVNLLINWHRIAKKKALALLYKSGNNVKTSSNNNKTKLTRNQIETKTTKREGNI